MGTHVREQPSSDRPLVCNTAMTSLHLNDVAGEYYYVCHEQDPLLVFSSYLIFWAWEGLLVLMIRDTLHITEHDDRAYSFFSPLYKPTQHPLLWHLGKDGRTLVCVFS